METTQMQCAEQESELDETHGRPGSPTDRRDKGEGPSPKGRRQKPAGQVGQRGPTRDNQKRPEGLARKGYAQGYKAKENRKHSRWEAES